MTDWPAVLRAVSARVLYKAVCAACGKTRMSPVFTLGPQFCNRQCHDAWEALQEANREH